MALASSFFNKLFPVSLRHQGSMDRYSCFTCVGIQYSVKPGHVTVNDVAEVELTSTWFLGDKDKHALVDNASHTNIVAATPRHYIHCWLDFLTSGLETLSRKS